MKQKREDEGLFVKKKLTSRDLCVSLYDILEHFKPLIRILNRLIRPYRLYYPWDSSECARLVVICILKVYGMSAAVILVIFGTDPSVFSAVLSVYLIYVFSTEIINNSRVKLEIRFLKSFEDFLSNIRHHYYKNCSIRNALSDAENDAAPVIKGHISEMLKVLSSPDALLAVNEYVNKGYHRYLKLFITLARLVDENGDENENGNSVFLNSCMHIKYDVEEDLRFLSERKHRFSGLVLTATLPAVSIPYIAMWGVSTIPSLNLFYYGYVGSGVKLLLIFISLISFKAIIRLKHGDFLEKERHRINEKLKGFRIFDRISEYLMRFSGKKKFYYEDMIRRLCEKYTVKTFYLLRYFYFTFFFIITFFTLLIGHSESRKIYKSDISTIEETISVTDTRQLAALKRLIPEATAYYCETGYLPSVEELTEILLADRDIRLSSVAGEAAREIIDRIEKYRNEIFNISDIAICFVFALIAFFLPGMALSFRKALIESRMQNEVMQFQSIIHMLKKIPGITVISLLEEMELFSEIFKPAIRQCINEFAISDEKALKTLYSAERYPPFRRIIDCFLMADELGLSDAFEEISAEIENFAENRKLERKITMDSEGMLGAVISVLPGGIILFGYLLLPFMIRSMQIFNDYQTGINMMG